LRGHFLEADRYERQRRIWGERGQERIRHTSVLIAGAGGIGSEIIKNLALLGIGKLIIIDLDIIEVSNLNRQLLFKKADIGAYKAEIAAREAKKINEEIDIQFFNQSLKDLPNEVFDNAEIFVSALDNIPARIFLNHKAVILKKPLIDGGSEGFFGHVQVVRPQITPCLLCQDIWSRSDEKFKCSYAVYPRTPLDCVLEGRDRFFLEYKRLPSPDNVADLQKVYDFTIAHAKKFKILGVTFNIVKDSLKGTVAALITTNAIISAVMTNELLKILLKEISIDDLKLEPLVYYQFNGLTESGWTISLKRNDKCPVCGIKQIEIETISSVPLIQFINHIDSYLTFELQAPLLLKNGILLYRDLSFIDEKSISINERKRINENEIKPIEKFFKNGDSLFLKDEILGVEFWITIKFVNQNEGGMS